MIVVLLFSDVRRYISDHDVKLMGEVIAFLKHKQHQIRQQIILLKFMIESEPIKSYKYVSVACAIFM